MLASKQREAEEAAREAALREAQKVLQHFESAGSKYVTVARENKRLKKDLEALNDDGFWDELEDMKQSAKVAVNRGRHR